MPPTKTPRSAEEPRSSRASLFEGRLWVALPMLLPEGGDKESMRVILKKR